MDEYAHAILAQNLRGLDFLTDEPPLVIAHGPVRSRTFSEYIKILGPFY